MPKLKPAHECTRIPREVCSLTFGNPTPVEKPLKTKWCLDPTAPEPGETYDESEAAAEPLTAKDSKAEGQDLGIEYGAPPPAGYEGY